MKAQFKREYRAFTTRVRLNDGKTCRPVNMHFRLEHPNGNPSADQRIAMSSIILPELDRHFKDYEYTPGNYPCVDCLDCEEPCEHKGKEG